MEKADKDRITQLEIDYAKLDVVVNENKKDIEKLQDTTEILSELKVIVAQNSKQMDKQLETNEKLNATLTTMDTNLSKLNEEMTDINKRVSKIEDGSDRGKFDVIHFITHDALKYILIAILALALYKMGISK